MPRRQSFTLPGRGDWDCGRVDPRRLPSILSMRLCEWIDSLTHPITGAFPTGISPKQMDQLASSQIASSALEHGVAARPLWKTGNHLGVLLWNDVKAGRIQRLQKACYVGKSFGKLLQQHQNQSTVEQPVSSSSHPVAATPAAEQPSKEILFNHRSLSFPSMLEKESNAPPSVSTTLAQPIVDSLQQAQLPLSVIKTINEAQVTVTDSVMAEKTDLCTVCKNEIQSVSEIVLKCKGCPYRSHIECTYPNGVVPISLLSRASIAVTNWRCYDCKCCQLCSRKDDANDGLLLCDGCDSGEHMGCQQPPLANIPPAPWYCSVCSNVGQSLQQKSCSTQFSAKAPSPSSTRSPFDNRDSALIINEDPPSDESDDKSSPEVGPSSIVERVSSNSRSNLSDTFCKIEPTATQSAWVAILNSDTPPLSDEAAGSPADQNFGDQVTVLEKPKPIKIKFGKRPHDFAAEGNNVEKEKTDFDTKRPKTHNAGVGIDEQGLNNVAFPIDPKKEILEEILCPSKRKERNNIRPQSSVSAEDLPCLSEEDAKEVLEAKIWSVDRTSSFLERMGFDESAKAFRREEIDGPALLLLQRQDILYSLGVKLGPALKTYKFIKHIQNTVRSQ